jgi:hypothetical protein
VLSKQPVKPAKAKAGYIGEPDESSEAAAEQSSYLEITSKDPDYTVFIIPYPFFVLLLDDFFFSLAFAFFFLTTISQKFTSR